MKSAGPPECLCLHTELHCVIFQEIIIVILTTVSHTDVSLISILLRCYANGNVPNYRTLLKQYSEYLQGHLMPIVSSSSIEVFAIIKIVYSKTSLILTNWERTLVHLSESPNYKSATENMFRKVTKLTSRVFLGNSALF
jgi:hypothetical protein